MTHKSLYILAFCLAMIIMPQQMNAQQGEKPQKSYPNYERYEKQNETTDSPIAVFIGDSIFDSWYFMNKGYFNDNNYAGRGINAQVTSQMLDRFRADVIDLHPKVVVILAGTNDIAKNNGYVPLERISDNIISMAELAIYNGIKPIILSILPVAQYPWAPEIAEVPQLIMTVNARLKEYSEANGVTYIDFYELLKDEQNGLPASISKDGVHPNLEGYAIMEPIVKDKIDQLTSQQNRKGLRAFLKGIFKK